MMYTILCNMLSVEIGDKLKEARRWHRPALTQAELAEKLAVDTSTVGRWESKNHVPGDQLSRLAEVLGVERQWLVDGSDDLPPRWIQKEEPSNVIEKHPLEMSRAEEDIRKGLTVLVATWRGVQAGSGEECMFVEPDELDLREVPLYLTMGEPDRHILCVAAGMSMSPRIEHTERALARLDPDVPPGHLIVAERPDRVRFIKRLVKDGRDLILESVNNEYPPIRNLADWCIKGGVTAILHTYEPGKPNIEWDEGRYLK